MSLTVEKSNRNFEDKDGRQVQVNEGICKVRLHGEYIGAVAQTNYYNDCLLAGKCGNGNLKKMSSNLFSITIVNGITNLTECETLLV